MICISVKEQKYLHDITFLSTYGDKKIKLVTCGTVRNSGIEDENLVLKNTYDHKLENNVSRSRSTILELALCNEWQYFVTLTLDKQNCDRYDLNTTWKTISKWLRNRSMRYGKIHYLLIPEQHQDGAWHFHGFLSGALDMRLFSLEEKLPNYVRDKLLAGSMLYDFTSWAKRWGWTICEPIRNAEAASRYVTKYITKDLSKSLSERNANLYYCSQGLLRSSKTKKGRLTDCNLSNVKGVCTGSYTSDYCTTRWYDYSPELLNQLRALIL